MGVKRTSSSPWKEIAQAICLSPSSFAIDSARPSLVKTAIEAYEFPKLIPTTGGSVEVGPEAGVGVPGAGVADAAREAPFCCFDMVIVSSWIKGDWLISIRK